VEVKPVKEIVTPTSTAQTPEKVDTPTKIARIRLTEPSEGEKNKQQTKKEINIIQTTPFNQEELYTIWRKYANVSDDIYLKNTMLYITPELKEDHRIEIKTLNPEQANKFKEMGTEIKEFLFASLKNNQITLDIKMVEDTAQQSLFTDKEKYQYMADKNQNLIKLVQEFNLRLD
jgi:hypothetical protein